MNRRRFCTLGGLALAGLAGCLGTSEESPEEGNGDDTATETETSNGNENGNGEGNGTGNGTDTDRPWERSDPVSDPDGSHHLFVENHTDGTESAWVRVVREDGRALVDGKYELPDNRAIEFSNIAAWEMTHRIDISLDGDDVSTLEWETAECGPDSEAPDGSRNGAVRYGAESADDVQFDLVVDMCDAIVAGSLPAGPAYGFKLDE